MKNLLFESIDSYCTQNSLLPAGAKIIIGLSGGPDSVFLLHYLHSIAKERDLTLIAVHLDHEWRPESGKDAQFCKDLAQNKGIQFVEKKMSQLSLNLKFNGSKEEMGRIARRHLFQMIKGEYHANYIALAHHAQDQQETFFIRLLRGSSLSGLTAMKPKDGDYVRPLLQINKSEIVEYLHRHKIAYLIDPSNESDVYLRNRIRATVIPALLASDERFNINFLHTLERLQETDAFLEELTKTKFEEVSSHENNMLALSISKILELHPVLRYRVILQWLVANKVKFPASQSFFDEILRFMESQQSKTHRIHSDWTLVKKANAIHIEMS